MRKEQEEKKKVALTLRKEEAEYLEDISLRTGRKKSTTIGLLMEFFQKEFPGGEPFEICNFITKVYADKIREHFCWLYKINGQEPCCIKMWEEFELRNCTPFWLQTEEEGKENIIPFPRAAGGASC